MTYMLFRDVLLHFQIFEYFPYIFWLLLSIEFHHGQKTYSMNSIHLCLLGLASWSSMSVNIPCALEKEKKSIVGWSFMKMSISSS